jgi:hypothetical protein
MVVLEALLLLALFLNRRSFRRVCYFAVVRIPICPTTMKPTTDSSQPRSSELGLIIKVLLLSTLLAFGIRYLGPLLPLPPTDSVALAMVLLPPVGFGVFLLWRWKFSA